jgi:hypothetical protein
LKRSAMPIDKRIRLDHFEPLLPVQPDTCLRAPNTPASLPNSKPRYANQRRPQMPNNACADASRPRRIWLPDAVAPRPIDKFRMTEVAKGGRRYRLEADSCTFAPVTHKIHPRSSPFWTLFQTSKTSKERTRWRNLHRVRFIA